MLIKVFITFSPVLNIFDSLSVTDMTTLTRKPLDSAV